MPSVDLRVGTALMSGHAAAGGQRSSAIFVGGEKDAAFPSVAEAECAPKAVPHEAA